MCRWNAYFGQPLVIDELLYRMDHGLIDQSRHARIGRRDDERRRVRARLVHD
jgi:hypothetical protein